MPEWWEGSFEERMARRRARREAEGLNIPSERLLDVWQRHGTKVVLLKKKAARKPFNYETWLHDKAGREMAEELALWEKVVRRGRLYMIWVCVIEASNDARFRCSPTLSQAARIKYAPRIRGCGRAANRADSAT